MADDVVEKKNEADGAAAEGAPAKPGKILALAVVGGGVLLGAALGLFLIGPRFSGGASAAGDSTHSAGGSTAGEHGVVTESSPSRVHVIDNLILNPAGSGGARFLMVTAAVELSSDAFVADIKSRDVEARDVVLRVLGAKTVEDLVEMRNRELLKQEVRDSLATLFSGPARATAVRRIYFPHFVIQ